MEDDHYASGGVLLKGLHADILTKWRQEKIYLRIWVEIKIERSTNPYKIFIIFKKLNL